MTVVPIRGISEVGLVKDVSPRELPPNAWTAAINVRFKDGKVRRAPVYRTYKSGLLVSVPYSFFGAHPQTASDAFYYTDYDGKVYRLTSAGIHGNVSALAHVDSPGAYPVTYQQLGEFTIINRQTEQPWYMTAGGANFAALPAWTSTHTCKALRQYKTFLVAINVTKTGTNYPYMVKTSDESVDGAMPTSWDHTNPALLATENSLTNLNTPLVDGAVLGDDFFLYTNDGVVKMSFRGDDNIFDYRDTGIGKGAINANCVSTAKRRHYVFGFNDIYAHDGVTAEPIGDGRINESVFKTLDRSKADRCFTLHDERNTTVWFFYPAGTDPDALWLNPTGCNRAAGYNYENNTWSEIDAPNVCGVAFASPLVAAAWSTITGTYSTATSFWSSYDDSLLMLPMLAAGVLAGTPPVATSAIYSFDEIDNAKAFFPALPVDTVITPPITLRKTESDVDELGLTLAHYKTIRSLFPQIESEAIVKVRFGSQMLPKDAITWTSYQLFDPLTEYKVDTMTGGRLVSFELKYESTSTAFELTAIDIDITATSKK